MAQTNKPATQSTKSICWMCDCETNNIHLRAMMASCGECYALERDSPDVPADLAKEFLFDVPEDPQTM